MKAIVYEQYGGPEVLALREVPKPAPKDNEVLVQVHAVSINDWDYGLLSCDTLLDRMLAGFSRPRRTILGSDIAGTVVEVGSAVRSFKPDDKVFGDLSGRWGGFAEYVCAQESMLAHKPEGMTFAQAAAIPQAAMLAVQGLIDKGELRAGQKILINGAGGGVGTFGLQIAKQFGAHVTGIDSAEKLDMLRALGFDEVADYKQHDFTAGGTAYDLILDVKTNRSPFRYPRALNAGGIYVTVGGALSRLFQLMAAAPLIKLLGGKRLRLVALKPNKDLAYICSLFDAGKLLPVLDREFTLDQVPEAMRHFGAAHHKGKIIIRIDQQ